MNKSSPAFPSQTDIFNGAEANNGTVAGERGMSLRQYYAAAALSSLAQPNGIRIKDIIEIAFNIADGMIAFEENELKEK